MYIAGYEIILSMSNSLFLYYYLSTDFILSSDPESFS